MIVQLEQMFEVSGIWEQFVIFCNLMYVCILFESAFCSCFISVFVFVSKFVFVFVITFQLVQMFEERGISVQFVTGVTLHNISEDKGAWIQSFI